MPYMETPLGLSARLMSAGVHAKNGYVNFLSVYAPILQSKDEDKDMFYNRLEKKIRKAPMKECFNHWPGVLGREGVGQMNENGQRLLELCAIQKMAVTNVYFVGKLSRKTSWMHPRSKHWHQEDLIMKRQCDLREIHHTRTYESTDCDTDHSLVCAKTNVSLKKTHCTKQAGQVRINEAKAQCPVSATVFNKDMRHVGNTSSLNDATTMWSTTKHGALTYARKYFGTVKRKSADWC